MPRTAVTATKIRNITKITFAIEDAPDAISVKPKSAAIMAIIKNIAAHFNIVHILLSY